MLSRTRPGNTRILQQNNDKPAAIIAARLAHGDSLAALARTPEWKPLVRRVAEIVTDKPVRHLQIIGGRQLVFLYEYPIKNRTIPFYRVLRPAFASSGPLIAGLVQGAWSRYIRRRNPDILGHATCTNSCLVLSASYWLRVCDTIRMNNVSQYTVIDSQSTADLMAKVAGGIKSGWQPLGGVAATIIKDSNGNQSTLLFQALVK